MKNQSALLLSLGVLALVGCGENRTQSVESRNQTDSSAQGTAASLDTSGTNTMDTSGQGTAVAPDNTGVNERDRNDANLTAQDQAENPADRKLASDIRQALVDDKSLSVYAHNVKIIARDGKVTLRGPVKSEQEKTTVANKAEQIAGHDKVDNQLEVAG